MPVSNDRSAGPFVLELRDITKRFGAVRANHRVSLSIRPGEIRGLVGENGAGKSTLMAIASGLYRPDAGEVVVGGVVRQLKGRAEAIALGINMVHQHFMLVPNCTVAQNVVLGQTGRPVVLRAAKIELEVAALADRYGIAIDARARVDQLTPTERQRAEIIAALWRGRTLLILDEPTSVLGAADVDELFATMRRVASEGCAVVFTGHKLKEVIEVCDAISVMRHGELKTTISRDEADVDKLATLMVGQALASSADASLVFGGEDSSESVSAHRAAPGAASNTPLVRIRDDPAGAGRESFGDLTISAGEIVGVAGVEGNGQRELVESLAGLDHGGRCRVEFYGTDITALGSRERASLGIAYVPEDPKASALVPDFPVAWNLSLRDYRQKRLRRRWSRQKRLRRRWSVDMGAMSARAAGAIKEFDIRGAGPDTRTAELSGGNQQKVVLAREFHREPRFLIIVDPTAGLDVGAAQGVHEFLRAHRDRGAGILLVSTDLDEIEALSDRVAVMYRGAIVDVIPRENVERRTIGLMMTGLSQGGPTRAEAHAVV